MSTNYAYDELDDDHGVVAHEAAMPATKHGGE